MSQAPFVSCLMPTYNRFPKFSHLVGEAVESFLRQDYPADRRELVLWNDTPGQILTCAIPGVVVLNTQRFATLGEKRNALVAVAKGDILLPWDDDDISLPNRVSQAVQNLEECDYWNPRHYWFWNDGHPMNGPVGLQIPDNLGYAHNCSAYTRRAFRLVSGYPATSGDEDQKMDARLRHSQLLKIRDGLGKLTPKEYPYIYRWGVSPRHLSGRSDLARHYAEIGEDYVNHGTYEVVPRWRKEYHSLVLHACQGEPIC